MQYLMDCSGHANSTAARVCLSCDAEKGFKASVAKRNVETENAQS